MRPMVTVEVGPMAKTMVPDADALHLTTLVCTRRVSIKVPSSGSNAAQNEASAGPAPSGGSASASSR